MYKKIFILILSIFLINPSIAVLDVSATANMNIGLFGDEVGTSLPYKNTLVGCTDLVVYVRAKVDSNHATTTIYPSALFHHQGLTYRNFLGIGTGADQGKMCVHHQKISPAGSYTLTSTNSFFTNSDGLFHDFGYRLRFTSTTMYCTFYFDGEEKETKSIACTDGVFDGPAHSYLGFAYYVNSRSYPWTGQISSFYIFGLDDIEINNPFNLYLLFRAHKGNQTIGTQSDNPKSGGSPLLFKDRDYWIQNTYLPESNIFYNDNLGTGHYRGYSTWGRTRAGDATYFSGAIKRRR